MHSRLSDEIDLDQFSISIHICITDSPGHPNVGDNAILLGKFEFIASLLSKGSTVVTDRLHAHILCCLLNIPHLYLTLRWQDFGVPRDVDHKTIRVVVWFHR